MKPKSQQGRSCSHCGSKYDGKDDALVDAGWAKLVLEGGSRGTFTQVIRNSCPDHNCREQLREDIDFFFGGHVSPKSRQQLKELM